MVMSSKWGTGKDKGLGKVSVKQLYTEAEIPETRGNSGHSNKHLYDTSDMLLGHMILFKLVLQSRHY